jgi:hypothetical protein
LREAKEWEGAETRIQLMESHCEELESLANQVEKQAVTETEPEPLIKLEEEMEYKKDNTVSLAQALKETIPVEFKERVQQAVLDSAKIAREGKRQLGDLRARLEFRSYKGHAGPMAEAGPESRPLYGAPERGRRQGKVALRRPTT